MGPRAAAIWKGFCEERPDAAQLSQPVAHALVTRLAEITMASGASEQEWTSFARFVSSRLALDAGAFERAALADLYLAYAVLAGQAPAIAEFDRMLAAVVHSVAAKLRSSVSPDELAQAVRVHLLIPREDQPPRLHAFRGEGALRKWLRVAVTRQALNLARERPREVPFEDAFFASQADLQTPEAMLLRQKYGAPIRDAMGRALLHLPERARAVLWFSLVDGLPAEQIAKVYAVHRTTASRWVDAAVAELRKAMDREVAKLGGGLYEELSSLVRFVLSRASR